MARVIGWFCVVLGLVVVAAGCGRGGDADYPGVSEERVDYPGAEEYADVTADFEEDVGEDSDGDEPEAYLVDGREPEVDLYEEPEPDLDEPEGEGDDALDGDALGDEADEPVTDSDYDSHEADEPATDVDHDSPENEAYADAYEAAHENGEVAHVLVDEVHLTHLETVTGLPGEYVTARQALNAYNLIGTLLMPASGGVDVDFRIAVQMNMLGMNVSFDSGGRVRMAELDGHMHVRVQMDLTQMDMGHIDERFVLGQHTGDAGQDAEDFLALFNLPALTQADIIRANALTLGDTHSFLFSIGAGPFADLVYDIVPQEMEMPGGLFDGLPTLDEMPMSDVDILVVFTGGQLTLVEMSFSIETEILGATVSVAFSLEYAFNAFGEAVEMD